MIFKHINESGADLDEYNNYVNNGKKAFVLIFMDGCGPCGETLPKWKKIELEIQDKINHPTYNDVIVASINKNLLDQVNHIGNVEGFPTIKYIGKNGGIVESYEDSPIITKDRSTSSFIEWIENKLGNHYSEQPSSRRTGRGTRKGKKSKTHRRKSTHAKRSKRSKQNKSTKRRHRKNRK